MRCIDGFMLPICWVVTMVPPAPGEDAGGDVPFDLLVRGGRVVDGTGAPWYAADVGVRGGDIVWIGPPGAASQMTAKRTIDAAGRVVAPGFIDMMGQTATPMLDDPRAALNLLRQGVTTINAGEGHSAAPLGADEAGRRGWSTMREYFSPARYQRPARQCCADGGPHSSQAPGVGRGGPPAQ